MNIDLPSEFDEMTEERKCELLRLIEEYFVPSDTINHKRSSYGLKHDVEHASGFYSTNGEFKGAMLKCGYTSKDIDRVQNCHFNVSKKSPIFVNTK